MPHPLHILVQLLTSLFVLGIVGCLLVIPTVAIKFIAVLVTRGPEQNDEFGGNRSNAEV